MKSLKNFIKKSSMKRIEGGNYHKNVNCLEDNFQIGKPPTKPKMHAQGEDHQFHKLIQIQLLKGY
ncbi:hypothetical protein Scep_028705 [Stephania cephalantha]|uniref:Uncharacterized protein n=1 Tax=Stephania cephalantha TaxID=152367 RepID=A0AAP0HID3_9MAGN